mmetsp:Transcript_16088/g.22687  ORF Transcript_16088/g.22687 Transcript_16088/m.22687 type:complete len:478 (-) Transcript_16088:3-1436(-)
MASKTLVINAVALTESLINKEDTPFLSSYLKEKNIFPKIIEPVFPALTAPAQATYLSGKGPAFHGITANGWYDMTYKEVVNWHQSSGCVKVERIWHRLKRADPKASVFVNGFWQSMHDKSIDYFINVRPQYFHDGLKLPDIYTTPTLLRDSLQKTLGTFPLHKFWGPGTGIQSSEWIVNAQIIVDKEYDPLLSFIYIPHLDYSLQKYGPNDKKHVPKDVKQLDKLLEKLITHYETKNTKIIILSEYGIEPVNKPIYLNRVLRNKGFLKVRRECGGETLDCGSSTAFALSDHQIAHIHINDATKINEIKEIVKSVPGVENVFTGDELNHWYSKKGHPIDSAYNKERSGDLIAMSDKCCWFAYYFWLDDKRAPDYAKCVAIHKKPGYDPAEMLLRFPPPFGFLYLIFKAILLIVFHIRTKVDATPIKCDSIRGSHGRINQETDEYKPIFISIENRRFPSGKIMAEDVCEIIWRHMFPEG